MRELALKYSQHLDKTLPERQGLTLIHFSPQPELCLSLVD